MTIFTIGHSNRTMDDFVALLVAHGVEAVVDVRHHPGSRKHPQFGREVLARELPRRGFAYAHLVALGGRRKVVPDSPNDGWNEPGFRGFADYALGPEFTRGLDELVALAGGATTAILCAEAVWWRCHRRIITDYLLVRGVEVRHILSATRAEPAKLTPFATPRPDGTIVYPASPLVETHAPFV